MENELICETLQTNDKIFFGSMSGKIFAFDLNSAKEQYNNIQTMIKEETNEEPVLTSGVCGDNLTWEYGDAALYIKGTGIMYDYNASDAPWYHLKDEIERKFRDKIWADTMNLVGLVPYNHLTGKPLDKVDVSKPEKEDFDKAINELYRAKGDYDLAFPNKENMEYYQQFFLRNKKNDEAFWNYIKNSKEDIQ